MKALQAINPLEGETGKQPELEKRLESATDPFIDQVLKVYSQLDFTKGYVSSDEFDCPVLMPAQINLVLHTIISSLSRDRAEASITGDFLTMLIKESYKAGHNHFF